MDKTNNDSKRDSWRDLWVPFQVNRYFQLAWIVMLIGIAVMCVGVTSWHLSMSRAARAHLVLSFLSGFAIFALGFVTLGGTEFGIATVKSYRTTHRRYQQNNGVENPEPNTWDQKRYASTYCAQIGVKAAAVELGHADDLPAQYAVWWKPCQCRKREDAEVRQRTGDQMKNVIQLRQTAEVTEFEDKLSSRFGLDQARLRAAIKPLFMLMHEHGIGTVAITRDGSKAVVTIDGEAL